MLVKYSNMEPDPSPALKSSSLNNLAMIQLAKFLMSVCSIFVFHLCVLAQKSSPCPQRASFTYLGTRFVGISQFQHLSLATLTEKQPFLSQPPPVGRGERLYLAAEIKMSHPLNHRSQKGQDSMIMKPNKTTGRAGSGLKGWACCSSRGLEFSSLHPPRAARHSLQFQLHEISHLWSPPEPTSART